MPVTPNLLLPYPSAGDPADVPADMQALAEAIDDLAGAADGLATLDSTGKVPSSQLPAGGGASTLDDLTDVATAGAADNDVLTYDSATTSWAPAAPTGGGGSGDPADDTAVWMPLFDSDGVVVFDGADGPIPTLIPLA